MSTGLGTTGSGPGFAIGRGGLLFVNRTAGPHYGEVALAAPGEPVQRRLSGVRCERVYTAARRVLCLRKTDDAVFSFQAVVLDDQLRPVRAVDVAGLPSRARLSADGAIASWTVFVSGDSYLAAGFSARTSVLDLRSGSVIGTLEDFRIIKDGTEYASPDVNFWGVTVAADDRTFYATLATKGKTYLVRGDLAERIVTTLAENVECPSLSPDGTRLVYKKREDADGGRRPWRLWVLDLATMKSTPLGEERSVDDQAMWLNASTVAYGLPVAGTSGYDVWAVPASGGGTPRLLLSGASSPAVAS